MSEENTTVSGIAEPEAAPTSKRRYVRRQGMRSGGRPAVQQKPEPVAAGAEAPQEERLTRRSRRDGFQNDFDIPEHLKKPGWDYEWKTMRVMGEDVDPASTTRVYEGGWRPASAKEFRDLCPPSWQKDTVERYGMMLFMRPMRLTQEAREEDRQIAEKQKIDKLKGALASPEGQPASMPRRVGAFEITGEVGTTRAAER